MGYIWIAAKSCADKSFLYTRLLYFLRILWACAAPFYIRICWSSYQNVLFSPGKGLDGLVKPKPPDYFLSLGLLPSFQLLYFFLWLGIQQFSSSSQAY